MARNSAAKPPPATPSRHSFVVTIPLHIGRRDHHVASLLVMPTCGLIEIGVGAAVKLTQLFFEPHPFPFQVFV